MKDSNDNSVQKVSISQNALYIRIDITLSREKAWDDNRFQGLPRIEKVTVSKPLKCTVILFLLRVIKDGKCSTPSVVCSEERTSHKDGLKDECVEREHVSKNLVELQV